MPTHGSDEPQTDGFAEGLFGAETGCQIAHAALGPTRAAGLPGGEFGVTQYFARKALAVARQAGANATHVADVSADAVDHSSLRGRRPWQSMVANPNSMDCRAVAGPELVQGLAMTRVGITSLH